MRVGQRGIVVMLLIGTGALMSAPVAGAAGGIPQAIRVSVSFANGQPAANLPVILATEWSADDQHAALERGVSQLPLKRLASAATGSQGFATIGVASAQTQAVDGAPTPVTLLIGNGPVYVFHTGLSPSPSGGVVTVVLPGDGRAVANATSKACPAAVGFDRFWQRSSGNNYLDRDAAVGRVRTLNKTAASMTWSTSKDTSTEVFASAGSGLYAAGLKRLTSRSASATFDTKTGAGAKEYRVAVRYLPWDLWCRNNATGQTWITTTYEWRPDAWTGGSTKGDWTPWSCQDANKVAISSALTIGTSTTVTEQFDAGVTFFQVSGRTSQQYSSSTAVTLSYKLAGGAKRANLCGQTTYPAAAGEIIEVS